MVGCQGMTKDHLRMVEGIVKWEVFSITQLTELNKT